MQGTTEGTSAAAVYGENKGAGGANAIGVRGKSLTATGTLGTGTGVLGESGNGIGVKGVSANGNGVFGQSSSVAGVRGYSTYAYGGSFYGARAPIYLSPRGSTGPPSTGTHLLGELVVDSAGVLWICTLSSNTTYPAGRWQKVGTQV